MANETPNLHYREITDNPRDGEEASCCWIASTIIFILSLPVSLISFLFLLVFCNWELDLKISIGILILFVLFGLLIRYGHDKSSPRLKEAKRAKNFLGFDFGNDFRLRLGSRHEYMEILLDFDEDPFKPLEKFCKLQNEAFKSSDKTESQESESQIEIKPYIIIKLINDETSCIIKKPGFTKIHHDGNGASNCEVDYENRTLKYYVWWS